MPLPRPTRRDGKACVIGSGPNGLSAAIVLAQAGMQVEVFEAAQTIGGAVRTLPLTLPGFLHDFGSAVHPLAAGSPFFLSLPLNQYGLQWIHPRAPVAHPLDDGTAVVLECDLEKAEEALGADGAAWRSLMQPFATRWPALTDDILRPLVGLPRHPILLARFGMNALQPATTFARRRFRSEAARALFAGLAAHSFLALDQLISTSFGMVLGIAAHAIGWPIPRGGAQCIADALAGYLRQLGGRIATASPIHSLDELSDADLILCDVTPRQLLALAGGADRADASMRLFAGYRRQLEAFRYGPAAFKVDYALSGPIPWNAPECRRSATVHVGGSMEDIVASEAAMASGHTAERPFVLVSQPTLFDPTRAPASRHVAWAYCHVPNRSTEDMLPRIEAQIERFATGFGKCILGRNVFTPAALEFHDANLVGGDINGGAMDVGQFLFRPTRRGYRTSLPKVYLCSSSTPPGGGVHGMCGFHAAMTALHDHSR